ncbi:MAG: TVP38/TMEM64 family protein [Thermodesulfovibrionales bacterium]
MLKGNVIKSIVFILLLAVLFLSQFIWDTASYFDIDTIKHMLAEAGGLAPVFYVLTMAMAVVISPIPSLPLDIAAGAYFGPVLGTLYSVVGAAGGAVVSFLIARSLGREMIARFLGGHINFCSVCSDKLLTKVVFLSRLMPVVSFDVISYGAGLTTMSLRKFTLATFFGMIPLTFVYNYFGSVIVVGRWLTLVLGLVMVVLFFMIPRWIEKSNMFKLSKFFQHEQDEKI